MKVISIILVIVITLAAIIGMVFGAYALEKALAQNELNTKIENLPYVIIRTARGITDGKYKSVEIMSPTFNEVKIVFDDTREYVVSLDQVTFQSGIIKEANNGFW